MSIQFARSNDPTANTASSVLATTLSPSFSGFLYIDDPSIPEERLKSETASVPISNLDPICKASGLTLSTDTGALTAWMTAQEMSTGFVTDWKVKQTMKLSGRPFRFTGRISNTNPNPTSFDQSVGSLSDSGSATDTYHFNGSLLVKDEGELTGLPDGVWEKLTESDLLSNVHTLMFQYDPRKQDVEELTSRVRANANATVGDVDTDWVYESLGDYVATSEEGMPLGEPLRVPITWDRGLEVNVEGDWADRVINLIYIADSAEFDEDFTGSLTKEEVHAALNEAFGQKSHSMKVSSQVIIKGKIGERRPRVSSEDTAWPDTPMVKTFFTTSGQR